ncbi:hypothetical protein F4680DRAFT_429462 [Xylaria scruposa]|nr:hypothetical protein F4680DRAFT_429462 [Xylaria scruposa]
MAAQISHTKNYQPLAEDEDDQLYSESTDEYEMFSKASPNRLRTAVTILVIVLSVAAGFFAGATWTGTHDCKSAQEDLSLAATAPQIPVPYLQGEFTYSSPFSQEPPQGDGAGNMSEPIWDALVPNGLGYFKDGSLASTVSIPTTFHQLHCLYILRRAFYSAAPNDELEEFDFGKNRTIHAAHCFEYLTQTITCSVDTTVEPYEADEKTDGFLGSGFPRVCRDFDALKQYVEDHRVFNATGFLAAGIEHGKAYVHGDR